MLDILLVDDEPDFRALVGDALRDAGHRVTLAANGAEGLSLISANVFDVMMCDIRLPQHRRPDAVPARRARSRPSTDVILMTAYAAVADAVAALKEGAYDYLTKPFDIDEIILQMERIAEQRALQARAGAGARRAVAAQGGHERRAAIIGRSPPMLRLLGSRRDHRAERRARADHGRERHRQGAGRAHAARAQRAPRQAVRRRQLRGASRRRCSRRSCSGTSAAPSPARSSAATAASRRRDGGTLLLDEVAEMPLPAQAKLLRVLQEGTVEPLGTNEIDAGRRARHLGDPPQPAASASREGQFREDLYYRLNVLDIEIPPLRERRGRSAAAGAVLPEQVHARRASRRRRSRRAAWAALSQYRFPGNVRELAHAIEHAVVLAGGGEIDVEHLPAAITGTLDGDDAARRRGNLRSLGAALKEFEREYLLRALAAGQRQEDEGRRDPGHLAQEPLGEAAPARDRRRGRSRGVSAGSGRPRHSPKRACRKQRARTRAIRSSSSAASSVGGRPQAAGEHRQIARRDDVLGAVEQQAQPQRRAAQRRVVVAQRLPASPARPAARARRRVVVTRTPGSAACAQLAERDQELDVHDAARIEAQVARARRHAPALASRRAPRTRRRSATKRCSSNGRSNAIARQRASRVARAAPARRCCRRRARAAAPPAPSRPPRRGGSARTRSRTSPAAPARPTGAGACRPCRGAPPPASPPSPR